MLARSAPGASRSRCGKRRLHAAALGREARLGEQGVEPDEAPRLAPQRRELRRQQLRLAGVVAIADDDHAGARMDEARRLRRG